MGKVWRDRSVCLMISWFFLHKKQFDRASEGVCTSVLALPVILMDQNKVLSTLWARFFICTVKTLNVIIYMFLYIFENSITFSECYAIGVHVHVPPPVTEMAHLSADVTDHTVNSNVHISNIANWPQQDIKNVNLTFDVDPGIIMTFHFIFECYLNKMFKWTLYLNFCNLINTQQIRIKHIMLTNEL